MEDKALLSKTLGLWLDEQARRVMARALLDFPWAQPAARLQDHVMSLALPVAERFRRNEGVIAAPPVARSMAAEDRSAESFEDAPTISEGRPPAANVQSRLRAVLDSNISARSVTRAMRNRSTESLEDAPTVSTGRPLPADIQSRLRDVLGSDVSALRVHDDETADAVAGAHRAEALTVGRDVFFRQGRFQPHDRRGFGLLVHEATHVAQRFRPGAAWRRATTGGVQEDEEEALHRERAVVSQPMVGLQSERPAPTNPLSKQQGVYPPLLPRPSHFSIVRKAAQQPPGTSPRHTSDVALPKHSIPVTSSPALRPMAASVDRDRESVPPSPATPDLEELRRSLIRDVMQQLRSEFERGG